MDRVYCGNCGDRMRVAEIGVWVRDVPCVRSGDLHQCLRCGTTVIANCAGAAVCPAENTEVFLKISRTFIAHGEPPYVTGEMILYNLGWTKTDELSGESDLHCPECGPVPPDEIHVCPDPMD